MSTCIVLNKIKHFYLVKILTPLQPDSYFTGFLVPPLPHPCLCLHSTLNQTVQYSKAYFITNSYSNHATATNNPILQNFNPFFISLSFFIPFNDAWLAQATKADWIIWSDRSVLSSNPIILTLPFSPPTNLIVVHGLFKPR